MKKYIFYFAFIVFTLCNTHAQVIGDSLSYPKNQINIGTTGFMLPFFGKYELTSLHKFMVKPYRMIISNITYQRNVKNNIALLAEFQSFRTKIYFYRQDDPYLYGPYNMQVEMYMLSMGVAKNIPKHLNENFSLESKIAGFMQYRRGQLVSYGYDNILVTPLNGFGLRASLGEELLYRNKYLIGLNLGYNAYNQPDTKYKTNKHNFFLSNALYFGVRF